MAKKSLVIVSVINLLFLKEAFFKQFLKHIFEHKRHYNVLVQKPLRLCPIYYLTYIFFNNDIYKKKITEQKARQFPARVNFHPCHPISISNLAGRTRFLAQLGNVLKRNLGLVFFSFCSFHHPITEAPSPLKHQTFQKGFLISKLQKWVLKVA